MLKNIKYWAGLFDADGSFDFRPAKRDNNTYYLTATATLYQKEESVLQEFAKLFEADVKPSKGCSYVRLHGTKARCFMQEVKKHLVIKRNVVETLLELDKTTVDDLVPVRTKVKAARAVGYPTVFPARQWMAGYVDGDGCIHSSFRKKDGNLEFKLAVVSHTSQRSGLDLMHKQLGGYITQQGDTLRWNVSLSISKGKQVLGYFGKHLKMKKQQAALVLECLNSRKHLRREGASWEGNLKIHRKLQELKSAATTK